VIAEPPAPPGDYRGRLDEEQGTAPACPSPGEPRPQKPIGELGAGPWGSPLLDGELVAQGKDLDAESDPPAEDAANGGDERKENGLHGGGEGYSTSNTPTPVFLGSPTSKVSQYRPLRSSRDPHLSGTKHEPSLPAHAPRNSRDDGRVGILGTDRRPRGGGPDAEGKSPETAVEHLTFKTTVGISQQ